MLDFAQYDKIFPQACVDESEATLGRLALDRVRYAAELSEAPRGLYEEYLKAHSGYLIRRITDDRDLELAEGLLQPEVSDAGRTWRRAPCARGKRTGRRERRRCFI